MSHAHSPAFLKLVDECRKEIKEYTVDDILKRRERGDTFLFVDTREDNEWAAGRCQGAVHVGKGVIERDIEKIAPDKNADIVLYCGGGFRSAIAGASLKRMGYTRVSHMDGGIRAWRERSLPEDKD
jgi:rhodanese-related sulfurtransferase